MLQLASRCRIAVFTINSRIDLNRQKPPQTKFIRIVPKIKPRAKYQSIFMAWIDLASWILVSRTIICLCRIQSMRLRYSNKKHWALAQRTTIDTTRNAIIINQVASTQQKHKDYEKLSNGLAVVWEHAVCAKATNQKKKNFSLQRQLAQDLEMSTLLQVLWKSLIPYSELFMW